MATDSTQPLDDVAPESITPGEIDETELRAALDSSNPLVRQRGVEVCETLAEADLDAVRPFLDTVAARAGDTNSAVALRAIAILATVAESDPAALDGRLCALVGALDSEIVDIQLTGGNVLAQLASQRPDLVAPFAQQLIEAVRVTEFDRELEDFSDIVDDRVTQRTMQQHEREERGRRVAGRRTLINVVVTVAQSSPRSVDAVEELTTLLDDVDSVVTSGAVGALGELAADDPDAVAPVTDRLLDCLDHYHTSVRARAVWALGQLGDDAAVPKLRSVAESDDDEDIRELARKTAQFLAD